MMMPMIMNKVSGHLLGIGTEGIGQLTAQTNYALIDRIGQIAENLRNRVASG
jgi:hypothetical protein